MPVPELSASVLCRRCDLDELPFASTDDLEDLPDVLGQERAVEALRFAVSIAHDGYNVYALGPAGTGRHLLVNRLLSEEAATRPVPDDWCYVHDFERPQAPRALSLPPGRGRALRDDMAALLEDLGEAIPAAFDSEDYRARSAAVEKEHDDEHESVFEGLGEAFEAHGFVLLRSPTGLGLAPGKDGRMLEPEEVEELTPLAHAEMEKHLPMLREKLEQVVHKVPVWEKEKRDAVREVDREVTRVVVETLLAQLRERWSESEAVLAHLEAVQADVITHGPRFREQTPNPFGAMLGGGDEDDDWQRRYRVNLLVDREGQEGAPVVVEESPSLRTLLGRCEQVSRLGTLVTDLTRIRAGALHEANGGFLVLDVERVLVEPYAWQQLKQALRAREVRILSLGEASGLFSTASLDPEPIPLDVKVVLIGSRVLYYRLCVLDPEFGLLFKVPADFERRIESNGDSDLRYARLLATLIRQDGLRPFDRSGVARVLMHSSRLAGDVSKLTIHLDSLTDLLRESDHHARAAEREVVTAEDVDACIEAARRRAGRIRDRIMESIADGTQHIQTEGGAVGQVNGLSVVQMGPVAFGQPSRISAQVRLGRGQVLDIEREVDLGGPLHSKGVLILTGFLGARFGSDRPLALAASLVFEQSYGEVDGDSASLAETCALLSSIAELPLRQDLAITGSMDQHGRVQAVGGVNEKIEGFFAVCLARGLTGSQGVILPADNVRHLVLEDEVVAAVQDGRFHVWPVASVDEAMELLSGKRPGKRGAKGWTRGSVGAAVDKRLDGFAAAAMRFSGQGPEG